MCRIATISPSSSDPSELKQLASTLSQLFSSPNWQTFLVVATEQASSSLPPKDYPGENGGGGGQQAQMIDGFEIPPDVDIPPESFGGGGGGGDNAMGGGAGGGDAGAAGGGGGGGTIICPHCTFENAVGGGQDCEICGLPLAG